MVLLPGSGVMRIKVARNQAQAIWPVMEDFSMRSLGVAFVSALALLGGCAPTQQATHVKPSGFLGDYSKLREGGKGNPLLFYWNPQTDFRLYDKVLIVPVTIWRGEDSSLDDVPPQELQHLATLLEAKIIEAVKAEGLRVVHEPGPGVMRIRAALTEARQANVVMDTISTVVPVGQLFSGVKKLATGTNTFVGKAGIEGEITDSETGEVLAAMVDRRAGAKTLQGTRNSWFHVEQAFQYWSDRFRQRLCEERSGQYCVPAE